MYIHKLGGGWLSHSFWRGAFLLNRQEDLQAILASALPEVWIDLSRGLDVAQEHEARTAAMTETAATLSEPAGPAAAALRAPPPATPPSDKAGKAHTTSRTRSATFAEESVRARRICKEAREAVVAIFAQARMGRTVDADASLPLVEEIADSVSRNPDALVSMARLRARNDYTYMHSVAVCALMVALAQQLGLPDDEVREAGLAGLMHDLGKAMMPPDVLNKPGALTPAEFAIMREHPVEGWKLLRADGAAGSSVRTVALHHHEKFDGSGYPARLSGEAIPLVARMGAICDVYDAITTDRPYKNRWDPAHAVRQMSAWTGHFDPVLLQAFIKSLGIYPVGSLVRLASGRLAVVSEQNPATLLKPVVKVFFSVRSGQRMTPERLDLALADTADHITGIEDPAVWKFHGLEALWQQ